MQNTSDVVESLRLTNLPIGADARVVSVNGEGRVIRRLLEMGLIPGVSVKVIKTAPFGDPIEVRVRGYSLAMRKNEADSIEVSI
jgi:Fe2+ transport system protein FeoA